MIGVCIYQGNRGLGPCEGVVSKLKVANKRSAVWKGLNGLAERLKETGEEPGVCKAHEKRAGENGYLLAEDAPPAKGAAAARRSRTSAKPAATPSGAVIAD